VEIACICHARIDPTQSLAKERVLLSLEAFKILFSQSLPKVKWRQEILPTQINYPTASSGVFCVMPDLIRHPVRFLDSGVRRKDGIRGKPRGMHP